jgi:hypothetical protein
MKCNRYFGVGFLSFLVLFILLSRDARTQGKDSLLIHFKNGSVRSIPIARIQVIKFDTLSGSGVASGAESGFKNVTCIPNPASSSLTIQFSFPVATSVSLLVHDMRGNLVRQVGPVSCLPGTNQVKWDGRNQGGGDVSAGVYDCELVSTLGTQHVKTVLCK